MNKMLLIVNFFLIDFMPRRSVSVTSSTLYGLNKWFMKVRSSRFSLPSFFIDHNSLDVVVEWCRILKEAP